MKIKLLENMGENYSGGIFDAVVSPNGLYAYFFGLDSSGWFLIEHQFEVLKQEETTESIKLTEPIEPIKNDKTIIDLIGNGFKTITIENK